MSAPNAGSTLGTMFPASIDRTFRGPVAALWLFGAVVAMRTAIAAGTVLNGRTAAQSADGIPLDRFGADGAAAVVALFALWGLAQLALSALGVLALVRYRSMVPLLFALFLVEHLARRVLLFVQPIARGGTPPGLYINLGLLAVTILGLVLSLRRRPAATAG